MSVEAALVAILDAASTTAGTRTYPILLPDEPTFPAITYQDISDVPQYHRDGETHADRLRFQVNCWGKTFEQARALAGEVRAAVSGYSGTIASERITRIFVENQEDDFETGTELFWRRLDLVIWHRRA